MKLRIITGVTLALLLLPIVLIDVMYYVLQGVFGFFVLVAAYELIKMYETKKQFGFISKLVIMGCSLITYISAILMINLANGDYNFNIVFAAIIFDILAMLCLALFAKYDTEDVLRGMFTVMYTSFGVIALMLLRDMNVNFILYILLATCLTDVFAYFGGVTFGKNKMAPEISPKKTWEGAVIGSIISTIITTLFVLFFGINGDNIFALLFPALDTVPLVIIVVVVTLIITVAGQIGDLLASKMKREYDIKDFGSIFPGHGGVLDRFDSVIFVAMFMAALYLVLL